ncbi:MAG TPA: hypothetical protein QGI22_01130 [Candidatus Woesearchaeota archaeon]|jgi:hypothetical protein|nr:hypothetical protein [Candidatus Woesearchaeota archaeon]HJN56548.1 hypothetical protein [Candidatus Woesearchaeota archaeon]|tara:strand:- start:33895 stop:34302 length:408 start_codon:yes stop_codon:yes gene_type:complete
MPKTIYPPPDISSLITDNFSEISDLNKEIGKEYQILKLLNQAKQEMKDTYQKMLYPEGAIQWYNLKIDALHGTYLDYHPGNEIGRSSQMPYQGAKVELILKLSLERLRSLESENAAKDAAEDDSHLKASNGQVRN